MNQTCSDLPADADTVLIVVNPRAGRGRASRASALVNALGECRLAAETITQLDSLADRAGRLNGEGRLRAIVAAGGDGTVAEIVNRAILAAPVTVLPLGTANLLAKYLELTADPRSLAQTIRAGRTIRLDAGRANGRIFVLMAGIGFDAEVVERLHSHRQGPISTWSYAKPILSAIRSYQYPALRVYCDARPPSEPLVARWAFVVNLPPYGGGLSIAPDASGSDGLLDVATFRKGSLSSGLWYLAAVAVRQQRRLCDCTIRTARRVRIESDEPVPYQLDGDPGGMLPLEIETLPGRLTLLVPPDARICRQASTP